MVRSRRPARSLRAITSIAALSLGAGTLGACQGTLDASGDPDALIITGHCEVGGAGTMPAGDDLSGSIRDESGTPVGSWTNTSADGSFVGTPDWLECRVNGSTVADFTGSGTWNGTPGYTFRVHVQDRGSPGDPIRVETAPTTVTVSATRTYSPPRATDGTASWDAGAYVTIPSSLPVTVGNAANQWATVTFAPDPGGAASLAYPVRCRYQGGAHSADPRSPSEIAAGLSYTLVDCQRPCDDVDDDVDEDVDEHVDEGHGGHGHRHGRRHSRFYGWGDDRHSCHGDHDDGEDDDWCTDPAIFSGAELEVASVVVHVDGGASRLPSRRHAQTTVSVDLAVTPFVFVAPENDFYRLAIWDAGGNLVHSADGDLATGDTTVTLLP
ncbi:MAG: hypothetical protein U0234_19495 [Sandaracinus sp.]